MSTDEPESEPARFEERNGKWVVIYRGTVVGRHTAKYRAKEQADSLNR
jgi:hypothetical protein